MNFKAKLAYFYFRKIKKIFLPRDLIIEAVKRNKNKIAVVEENKSFTYQEIYERGKKLANSLADLGLNKGDKIAILLYNCREYFEIRIAAYLSGLVLCPLVPDTLLEDIIFILNDCNVKAIIYHNDLYNLKIKENTKIKFFISAEKDYEALALGGESKDIKIDLKPEDLASINFSSGTTGRSKGIMLMQKNWVSSFYNYVLNSPRASKKNIKMLHIISLATAGGTAFLPSFFLGIENYFIDKFDEKEIINLIEKQKINTIFVTPSWLNLLIDFCKYNEIKLKLENIIIGTEYISREKFKEAIEFFGPIIQEGYGMAEVLPPLSLICSKDYLKEDKIDESKLIFAGIPMQGVEAKIVDKKGKMGRIAIKSKTVSAGYWNNLELSKKCFKDGWFIPDDFGYINEQGYLYVAGRAQDIIDSENMIFRRDIEEVLYSHSDILEAYVFLKNNKIYAFTSLKKGSKIAGEKELLNFCNNKLKNLSVESIKIVPVFPKNYSGKIDRKKLLSQI